MKETFLRKNFRPESIEVIANANIIIEEYEEMGLSLTLRQLYYQFVSRDLLENLVENYKRLGDIISSARLAGLVDWNAIEDRTRNLVSSPHWGSPSSIIKACVDQYRIDRWDNQEHRVEVWIEKEALAGVFSEACDDLDVSFFACRGYTSQSEMYVAGKRLATYAYKGQTPVILHFGDHDPSGIDMTRDVQERLEMFAKGPVLVHRIALNRDQIDRYKPPPNPAKTKDPRFADYKKKFGEKSWELDALDPRTMKKLIEAHVDQYRDMDLWEEAISREEHERSLLVEAANFIKKK